MTGSTMLVAMASVALNLAVANQPNASELATWWDAPEVPEPIVGGDPGHCGRILRGDWEPPDAMLVVYTGGWESELELLLRSFDGTPVVLVSDHQGRWWVDDWLRALPRAGRPPIRKLRNVVDTPWVRDWGPVQIRGASGASQWLDMAYLDPERRRDDRAPRQLAHRLGRSSIESDIPFEGGAVASDGRGLCVVTAEYLWNTGMSPTDDPALQMLFSTIGCCRWAIVPALRVEETKHADLTVQFVSDETVLVAGVDPLDDVDDAGRLEIVATTLSELRSASGTSYRVVRVPMPRLDDGTYASYVNAIQTRDAIVVPSYGEVSAQLEAEAHDAIGGATPRRVEVSPADPMRSLGGALHCVALGLFL